jgi:broad specificity phosphatase PhoE
MTDALQLIGSRHLGEAVAAITHAVMIRLALVKLDGTDDEGWRLPVGRGSVTEFVIQDGAVTLATPTEGGLSDSPSPAGRPRVLGGGDGEAQAAQHADGVCRQRADVPGGV